MIKENVKRPIIKVITMVLMGDLGLMGAIGLMGLMGVVVSLVVLEVWVWVCVRWRKWSETPPSTR